MKEAFEELKWKRFNLLDDGFVTLVDVMGTDQSIVEAARVSYGEGTTQVSNDRGLIRYLMRHRHCYDSQTEVLTGTGFMSWSEVYSIWENTQILPVLGIWDPQVESLVYETPEYLTCDSFEGDMYSVSHGGVDLLVTPEHSMWAKRKHWNGRQMIWNDYFDLTPANELENRSMIRYSKLAPYNAKTDYTGKDIPFGFDDARELLRMFSFFIGDGSVADTSANCVGFNLKKQRKRSFLREVCLHLGWEFRELSDHSISVHSSGISKFFRSNFYDERRKKCIPDFLLKMNREDSQAMLDGFRASDGTENRGTWSYSTSVESVAENLQIIALHAGEAAHFYAKSTDEGMWEVSILSRMREPIINQHRRNTSMVPYSGKVYCAKTRTGVLVVRRNGKVVLSGNTSPFEMCEIKLLVRVPMDCWRQWIRHRTACLSGDTILSFESLASVRDGKRGVFPRSVKDIYDLWHKGVKQEKDASKKSHFLERVDVSVWYTASELALLVERDDVQIRQLIQRGMLVASKVVKPMLISGFAWNQYADAVKEIVTYIPIRDRIKSMNLRMLNEDTGEIEHTKIIDIWESGEKELFEVEFSNGGKLKASKDHLCYTENGWLKLKDALELNVKFYSTGKRPAPKPCSIILEEKELLFEKWAFVVGFQDEYLVSNLGRIKSKVRPGNTENRDRADPILKKITKSQGRLVVGLSQNGITRVHLVSHLVAESFLGPRPEGLFVCHIDGNCWNNRAYNLYHGTPEDNADDRMVQGGDQTLTSVLVSVVSCKKVGIEMTYDLEVEGPFHNFIAGGVVVHNSVNEYSTRYSEAINSMAKTLPDQWRSQSKSNKQGSDEMVDKWPEDKKNLESELGLAITPGEWLTNEEFLFHVEARELYEERLRLGVAREQARKDLPLSTYTEAYWKIDLHNMFHFLSLRMDSHAQQEIREYATVIGNEIVKPLFPLAWEAFEDYRLNGMLLTKDEQKILGTLIFGYQKFEDRKREFKMICHGQVGWDINKNNRERDECFEKMKRLGVL